MKTIIKIIITCLLLSTSLLYGGGMGADDKNIVTRADMAKLILLAKNDNNYLPPAATGGEYSDVLQGDVYAPWIEQLKEEGITEGCDNNKYCPNQVVTKLQLAKTILKAKYGAAYIPPAGTGIFSDIPLGSFNADWIEALSKKGITDGCDNNKFCPNDAINSISAGCVSLEMSMPI